MDFWICGSVDIWAPRNAFSAKMNNIRLCMEFWNLEILEFGVLELWSFYRLDFGRFGFCVCWFLVFFFLCVCVCVCLCFPPNSKVWGSLLEKRNAPGWMGGTRLSGGTRIGTGGPRSRWPWFAGRDGWHAGLDGGPQWLGNPRKIRSGRWIGAGAADRMGGTRIRAGGPRIESAARPCGPDG